MITFLAYAAAVIVGWLVLGAALALRRQGHPPRRLLRPPGPGRRPARRLAGRVVTGRTGPAHGRKVVVGVSDRPATPGISRCQSRLATVTEHGGPYWPTCDLKASHSGHHQSGHWQDVMWVWDDADAMTPAEVAAWEGRKR
jgi:hypothetical protein